MKIRLLLIFLLASFTASQTAQPASKPVVDIREVMSASELTEAGLQKLSSKKIAALNAWLSRYSVRLMASASAYLDLRHQGVQAYAVFFGGRNS